MKKGKTTNNKGDQNSEKLKLKDWLESQEAGNSKEIHSSGMACACGDDCGAWYNLD